MRRILGSVAALLVMAVLAPAGAYANATVTQNTGSTLVEITGDTLADDITVTGNAAQGIVVSRAGGGLTPLGSCSGGATTVTCPPSPTLTLSADLGGGDDQLQAGLAGLPISVAGGTGTDILTTGGGADVLAGGDGGDTLDGRGAVDEYFGEAGDDTIKAHDTNAERISCGAGTDVADNDFTDIIAECERGIDGDSDGFSTAVDCNDAAATIFPGATEIFDNGIDENCDGRDNPNLDVDGDGFPRPFDCNDSSAAIRPTVPEIRGNRVDENCDNRADPFADLGAVVANQWVFGSRFSRLLKLVVHNAPGGARVSFRCAGRSCPTRRTKRVRVRSVLTRVTLHRPLRRSRLRPGTKLTVTITAAETIGRTYTYVVKRGAAPETKVTCRAPRQRRGRSC